MICLQDEVENPQVARAAGFSLHAGVAANAHQCQKLERLTRETSCRDW